MDDVLHVVRIKGLATTDAIAETLGQSADTVEPRLRELAGEGLVFGRAGKRPGWVLTPEGRERHAALVAAAYDAPTLAALTAAYDRFLGLNASVKGLCARWQGAQDDAKRFDLLDELGELQAQAGPVLTAAGESVPRFGGYGDRLSAALERAEEDPRYVVSPLVDSYHTVWFEAHEDFLVTLGRDRAAEGSA